MCIHFSHRHSVFSIEKRLEYAQVSYKFILEIYIIIIRYVCLFVCATFSETTDRIGLEFTWAFVIIRPMELNKIGSVACIIMHKLA